MSHDEYFDDILILLRTGRWNFYQTFVVMSYNFLIPQIALNAAFLVPVLNYECHPASNETSGKVDKCEYDKENNNLINRTVKCTKWNYDKDVFHSSLTSDFDLVCDYGYIRPTYQTLYMFGYFLSSITNGMLSDRYGRKVLILTSLIVETVAVFIPTFIPNILVILVFRFISGLCHAPLIQSSFVLALEACEPKHRSAIGVLVAAPWGLGIACFGLAGYFIRDWRWIQRVTGIPAIISLFMTLCLVDESPRWLIVRGQHQKAMKIIKKAFMLNGSPLPPEEEIFTKFQKINESSMERDDKENHEIASYLLNRLKGAFIKFSVLLRTSELRKRTLLMYVCMLSVSTVYYGLSFNAVNFKLNPYIYMCLNGMLEVPAYTLPVIIIAKVGRIKPIVASFIICGVLILSLGFISRELKWIVISFAMIGKFFISSAYQVSYLVASEVFPTEVRMQGLGSTMFLSRIGPMVAPFIIDSLAQIYPFAPSIVFGSMSILSGVAVVYLPETLNCPLPETIKQLEECSKTNKDKRNNRRKLDQPQEEEEEEEMLEL